MNFDAKQNFYDILEITSDSSPQDIRDSYIRLKSAFSKDSMALYSLIETNETAGLIIQIENAFKILSDPERRKKYDREYHQKIGTDEKDFFSNSEEEEIKDPSNVTSIDRIPPMEDSTMTENMLVAPSTDFTSASNEDAGKTKDLNRVEPKRSTLPSENSAITFNQNNESTEIEQLIQNEKDFHGDFIKKVRETRRISIEEMAEFTKVSRTYIRAIESEDYSHLPAAVYLRGFIIQIAKKLNIPHDKVAASYVARYRQACPDKA